MPAFLKFIDIENFKSYCGHHRIGPLKSFTAVVGHNGSGKSNFMDAVSFVMGEQTSLLCVKQLSDLTHGASINKPVARSASVTATFILEDLTEKRFQRSVIGQSSDHKIDGQSVSKSVYLSELDKLGINVKATNFLVFQGAVESIAMKDPNQLTALFEEISGSGVLKEQYEQCRAEVNRANEEAQISFQQKKGLVAERKEAKFEKEEAENYTRLSEQLQEQKVELQFFHLYHNEREIHNMEEDLQRKQSEITKLEKKRQETEDALKDKKKELRIVQRVLDMIEQEIRDVEAEVSEKHPTFIKAKERVTHTEKKLKSATKALEQARRAHQAHQAGIKMLEDELKEVEEQKAVWEASILATGHTGRSDVHLEEAQIREYEELKMEASRQAARHLQDLGSVTREQKSDQDRLDYELRTKEEFEYKHRQKGHEKNEAIKRVEKLNEDIKSSEQALEEQRTLRNELQNDVAEGRRRAAELQAQLEDVASQLGDASVDKHEEARRRKKQEIVEYFKREIPGVYDRMINMCHPTHKRYNVAVTRALGKYMEAIVVDTVQTACRCIQVLKEHRLEPEIFLPLDYIQPTPLKERLRDIKEPRNVKLVLDVLWFEPAVRRAVLFVTNNALVCETPEDASRVAYDLDRNDDTTYDALALDGTFYQKSGIMSGGSLDLMRKAKRWDDKHLSQLKAKKEKLTEELREAKEKCRKESELTTVYSQIRGLELRIKYAVTDRDTTLKQIKALDAELAELERKVDNFLPQIEEIERAIRSRDLTVQEVKESLNNVEDVVFGRFCRDIGVANIRQYEERVLRAQQERMELEAQIDRIASNLQFERSRDTHKNVTRWERTVQDWEGELEAGRRAEAEQRQDMDRELRRADAAEAHRSAARAHHDHAEDDVNKAREDAAAARAELQAAREQISTIQSRIESKRSERLSILRQCKIDDIFIPLLEGSFDDTESDSFSLSTTQQYQKESRIRVDYSALAESLKNLEEPDEIKRKADNLQKAINSLRRTVDEIQAPNMRAMQKLNEVRERLSATTEAYVAVRKRATRAKVIFEKVKKERHDKFMDCFEHVANEIDSIYKALVVNQSAQAFLGPHDAEEPYLGGISYDCVAPGKRYQPMSNLSGGENTVAALALLFAIHSYRPAPFILLDEIDAALDNTNIGKVVSYIHSKRDSLQTIVISLKEELYGCADALIGITSEPADNAVSDITMLSLDNYED